MEQAFHIDWSAESIGYVNNANLYEMAMADPRHHSGPTGIVHSRRTLLGIALGGHWTAAPHELIA
jgi:hypothetical protein